VTFKFDDGVDAVQRQIIENGMSLARSFLGDAGPVTVLAYANFDNLASDTDKAFHRTASSQGSLTFRQSFLTHIWKASGGAGTISIWVDDAWKGLSLPVRMHTMSHEYFHTIQASLSNKALTTTGPIWLYEGAADIAGFGAVAYIGGAYTLNQVDAYKITASRGLLSPLSSMITLADTEQEDSEYPYQLGYLAIEYLIPGSVPDRLSVLRKYWEAQGKGVSWQDAFKQTFGMSIDDFYPKFEEYRQANFPPYCGTVGAPVAQATAAPFGVRFVRQLAPGEMLALDQPWSDPPNIPYVFCVDGISLQSLGTQLDKVFTFPSGRAGWSACGAGCITIYMKPSTPAGKYNFGVTLPDGRRAQVSFQHSSIPPNATPGH
jgi:hypothetical protein